MVLQQVNGWKLERYAEGEMRVIDIRYPPFVDHVAIVLAALLSIPSAKLLDKKVGPYCLVTNFLIHTYDIALIHDDIEDYPISITMRAEPDSVVENLIFETLAIALSKVKS